MTSVYKRGGKANRTGCYYMSWHDHRGRRHSKSSKTTDKAAAERIAAKLEADAALRRDGVIDAAMEQITQQSQRTIESHLGDYEAKITAAGRTEGHVNRAIRMIRTIAERAGFDTIGDITADGVNVYAGDLLERRSARTVHAHLTAVKGFTRWLSVHGKLPADPLASVRKPNPKSDPRLERRMLLHDEWHWLRSVALAEGPARHRMAAEERILLYAVAIQTGLRVSELRSLTRGRLFLDGDQPYITCKARSTKDSKPARQYVQPELAAELRRHGFCEAVAHRLAPYPVYE